MLKLDPEFESDETFTTVTDGTGGSILTPVSRLFQKLRRRASPALESRAVCAVLQQQLYGESRNSLVLVKMLKHRLGLELNFQKCSGDLKLNLSKFNGLEISKLL